MVDILKFFLEKLTKHFWQAIFLTALTLFILAKSKTNTFNFGLFETWSGAAQALIVFLLLLSAFYLLLSLCDFVVRLIQSLWYELVKKENAKNEMYAAMAQFIENLFNAQSIRTPPVIIGANVEHLKCYLVKLYKSNIGKFKANEIADIFERDADEKQKNETKEGVFYYPMVSRNACIAIQDFLYKNNFLFFDGEFYITNDIIFKKLKELENRGM